MASSNSPKVPKLSEANQDLISNLPSNAIDKILKRLPLKIAAKMSVLSKKWRDNWLSFRYLFFDKAFWLEQVEEGRIHWDEGVSLINSVLLHHNGSVHEFHLDVVLAQNSASRTTNLHLSQWLSFLSRTGVKKMILKNCWIFKKPIPSYIYLCKDLVKLSLERCIMSSLPSDFKGFAYLRSLELFGIQFKSDIFSSLIASCPRLTSLKLKHWDGTKNLVLDVPNLEHLTILGLVDSLVFKNVPHLSSISLSPIASSSINSIAENFGGKFIASLCEVKNLHFGKDMCKILASVCISKSLTLAFNYLHRLCLTEVGLHNFDVYRFTLAMLQSCPAIEDLEIAIGSNRGVVLHVFECDVNFRLAHLLKAKITGITGSGAELKLIECLLSTAVMLEELLLSRKCIDASSEVKLLHELLQLPRASTKARLVCMKQ